VFQRRGIGEKGEVLGEFQPTGIRPKLAERLEMAGVHLPFEMFEKAPVRR
jgi:pilus assembly protein CpaF